jgi:hypothetical protein
MKIQFIENTIFMKWGNSTNTEGLDTEKIKKARISLLTIPALLEHGKTVIFPFPG